MKMIYSKLAALILLFALAPVAAIATPTAVGPPVLNSGNNNSYQVFQYNMGDDKTWDVAKAFAEIQFLGGVQGHLATINTSAEDTFVIMNLNTAGGEVWLGGSQADDQATPGDGWSWINGEGVFPGVTSPDPNYANWSSGEPNDVPTAGENNEENHLAIFLGSQTGWNDEGNLGNMKGLIIEFEDGTVTSEDCDPDCNPSGLIDQDTTDIEFPAGESFTQMAVEPDPTGNPGAIVYCDPRVGADGLADQIRPLDVFAELGGGPAGALILNHTIYGSPCFAVVEGTATFAMTSGVLRGTQFTNEIPDIGNVPGCTDPDMQKRLDFGFQTTFTGDMIENSAAAVTNDCFNPSRGATFEFSYWILNLHEDCGIDYSQPGGPHLVLHCFRILAIKKFVALGISLKNAKPHVISPRYRKLRNAYLKAFAKFLLRKYNKSLAQLDKLHSRVMDGEFGDTFNHQGNLLMRIENLQFREAELKAAEAALP